MSSRQPAPGAGAPSPAEAIAGQPQADAERAAGELEILSEPDCDPYNSTGRFCVQEILSANDD